MDDAAATHAPVLVTGATGFLGARLAAMLRERGDRVRALARPTSDLRRLADLGVELVEGDVSEPESVVRAAAGCRLVFHCAGKVSDWAPRAEFLRVNAGGTANVVEACVHGGVRRLVHVSSLTVLGLPRDGRVRDETAPVASGRLDFYTESKLAGERRVVEAHGRGGLETTVLRPGVIWGPGDAAILPRFRDLVRRGRMVLVDGGRNVLGLAHVDNLALALTLAGDAPQAAGRLYHVTDDETVTAREAVEAIADAAGAPRPRRSLPFGAVYAAAAAMEAGARLLGRREPPPLTRYGVRLVACDVRWNVSRLRRELGWAPTATFHARVAEAVRGGPVARAA